MFVPAAAAARSPGSRFARISPGADETNRRYVTLARMLPERDAIAREDIGLARNKFDSSQIFVWRRSVRRSGPTANVGYRTLSAESQEPGTECR
ncbi:hypothetical protein A4G85_12870 [Burkholderia pseudomallei]|nr:hypothetical protein A4G85_12870 [Burkholderia pseudomallei]